VANAKITDLVAIAGADTASDDEFPIVDVSAGSSGTHITVQPGGKLSGVSGFATTGASGVVFKILNQGYLERIFTNNPVSPVVINDGGTLANTALTKATGFAPANATLTNINTGWRVNNAKCTNVLIENDATSVNGVYLENSTTGGTYSDLGTNTLGYGNSGLIPNTGTSLSKGSIYFNGVTSTVINSTGIVSGITKNSTGDYTVNFSSTQTAGSYCAVVSGGVGTAISVDDSSLVLRNVSGGYGTSGFRFAFVNPSQTAFTDATCVNVIFA